MLVGTGVGKMNRDGEITREHLIAKEVVRVPTGEHPSRSSNSGDELASVEI